MPSASIAIPTIGRPGYLEVTLRSVAPQAARFGAEVVVVRDGADPATAAVAARHGAQFMPLQSAAGANAARNAAIHATNADLLVFVDDDIAAPEGWLQALLAGVMAEPDYDVFGGPIRARLEGGGPRACGRELAPITTLDMGPRDRDVPFVWSANMAVRRRAFDRVGTFDESIAGRGEEEEWQLRYAAAGGRVRYVAGAFVDHRRTARDSTTAALAKASYRLGRSARRNDVRKGAPPSLAGELRTVVGCVWHMFRRRCAIGAVMLAESTGRLREALTEKR